MARTTQIHPASHRRTSPSPLLMCSPAPCSLHHMDLYRLPPHSHQHDLVETLGLNSVFKDEISIIEWPDRLTGDAMPSERLEVHIAAASASDAPAADHEATAITRPGAASAVGGAAHELLDQEEMGIDDRPRLITFACRSAEGAPASEAQRRVHAHARDGATSGHRHPVLLQRFLRELQEQQTSMAGPHGIHILR